MPFHVAFFNRSFHPDTSATGQLLTELCEDLVGTHGCRVSVVTGSAAGAGAPGGAGLVVRDRYGEIEVLRARGTRFSKRRFVGRFSNYVTYFLSACYAGLRLDRPDVVVALTDPPIIGLAALLTARRFRVPFVMAYKDIFPEVARLLEDFRSATVDRVLQAVNCFLARKADRCFALGETMRRRLIEGKGAAPERTLVIEDWVDCAAIVPGPRPNRFSETHGLSRKFVVMHSGNIGLSQSLETLVEAADHLRQHDDIVIVVVGDGVKKGTLQAMVQQRGLRNVRFLPYQPKEGLSESFSAADVFVVSLLPGLAGYIVPSKLYGILAAGRPYVAAVEEECEVAAITRKHDCGLLVEPRQPRRLADAILALSRDRGLARQLGANAREAAAHFDRSKQARAYYERLLEVVEEARGRAPAREPRSKRVFDAALAALGLALSAPISLLVALAIKLDDGGPVFYAQPRVGQGGRRFRSWKFRSMIPDSDRRFGPLQAREHDPRITRVGRVLRATALDELPQLWNILKGDMSFVGPRALVPNEIEVSESGRAVPIESIPGYRRRHDVRPGLTGLAQVYAPRDISRRNKFRYDIVYIDRQGFCLDLRLVLLSFWITLRGRWESRGRKF